MKKIIVLLFALLLLSSCVSQSNVSISGESISSESVSFESSISVSEQSSISAKSYSFSEVNPMFGPGPFSVNELAQVFGEPTFLDGYYSERNKCFVLYAAFSENIYVELAANNGEKLSYTESTSSYKTYQVSDSDRYVRMKLLSIDIVGGNWELPRNIKFGDSINALFAAYNGDEGEQSFSEGSFMVSYNYGESGCITYAFETEEIDSSNRLMAVVIEWYNAFKLNDVSSTISGLPPL